MGDTVREFVDKLAREAWEAGYNPCAIRVNAATEKELRRVTTVYKLQSGGKLVALHTEYGNLRVFVDEGVPDDKAILQVEFKRKGEPPVCRTKAN